ncbi:MAG: amidohydrolase [Petrimonas sp.]|nr:amidohydrolase [Petrimonas sp.]
MPRLYGLNIQTVNVSQIIHQKTDEVFPEIVRHYRYLHQHPELSYQEENTARYIVAFLDTEGIPYRSNIGGYGILAWIKGEKSESGKTIAFVADMDALPVQEQNDVEYKSATDGVMHACGHDAQSAALMGAVKIVHSLKSEFAGTALFVFQPGEEKSPGGADLMLKDGVFRDFTPDFIVKQHAYIDLPAGTIGFQSGTIMASADEVHIRVKGQGGHGALPHELNDTVLAASNIVVAMQQLVSRRRNPFNPMVLSLGKFIANGATNVIPDKVTLAGSMRCMDEEERRKMLRLIPQIAESTAAAYGCSCKIDLPDGYPCVISDEVVTEKVCSAAIEFLGEKNVCEFPKRMTADDFGFFTQQYPCCYYRFGVAEENKKPGALHSGTFLIKEEALRTASGTFVFIALQYLTEN